jgi:hypothetical protein
MRADHSLEKARSKRQYRLTLTLGIVIWFALDDVVLSAVIGSNGSDTKLGYIIFFLLNIMFAYVCYCQWTEPHYKHLREKSRKRRGFSALAAPKDPSHRS